MIPRWAPGYWWSRWWAYTDPELEELVDDFSRRNLPIDVLVLDMEWPEVTAGSPLWQKQQACLRVPAARSASSRRRRTGVALVALVVVVGAVVPDVTGRPSAGRAVTDSPHLRDTAP